MRKSNRQMAEESVNDDFMKYMPSDHPIKTKKYTAFQPAKIIGESGPIKPKRDLASAHAAMVAQATDSKTNMDVLSTDPSSQSNNTPIISMSKTH